MCTCNVKLKLILESIDSEICSEVKTFDDSDDIYARIDEHPWVVSIGFNYPGLLISYFKKEIILYIDENNLFLFIIKKHIKYFSIVRER